MSADDPDRPRGYWSAGPPIELSDDEGATEMVQKIVRAIGQHVVIRDANSDNVDLMPNESNAALGNYSTAELKQLLDMLEARLRTLH